MLLNINDVALCEFFHRICWSTRHEIEVRKHGLWNELCKDARRYVERKATRTCTRAAARLKITDNEAGP